MRKRARSSGPRTPGVPRGRRSAATPGCAWPRARQRRRCSRWTGRSSPSRCRRSGAELDVGSHTLSWVLTAYFLAYGLMLFPGGALVDRIGSRRVGLYGLAVFAAGAAIGALAGSFGVLVASRLVQGVGAGLVSPASLAGAVSGFPPERRGSALGIWGASSGMANLIGPVVGGLLTVAIDWRACWWFFVPASAAVAWGLVRFVPRAIHGDESPDAAGLRQRVVAAAARGRGAHLRRDDRRLLSRAAVPAGGRRVLGARRRRRADADRGAGRRRGAARGRLSDERGEGADARRPASCSRRSALGALGIPGVPLDGPGALPLLVPFGLGIGLLFVPASRAALNAVPQAKHGRVSSLLSTCRLLGAALGAGLAGAALSGGVTASHVRIALLSGAGICLRARAAGVGRRSRPESGDASRLDFEVADRAAAEASSAGLNRSRR